MNDGHRDVQVLLGAYALGHLAPTEELAVRAHLDGCATCRAELAAIAPLRARLAQVDPDRLDHEPVTPPELGQRIAAAIRSESSAARATRARRRWSAGRAVGVVAVAASVAALAFGAAWLIKPDVPELPLEAVEVDVAANSLRDIDADVVPHTWGMEIKLRGAGFTSGEQYRVQVVTDEGERAPAGEFIGVGTSAMNCNLNSAVLRDDASGFEVVDALGDVVLTSSF